ncbi:chemotaxis-specific protein-glutamate methyltransferase CheB [Fluviispira multicolorata]|uniref:Protein-glutamate methylesterase/protein-glutamine glutaminase n=1 Tax=Fluviispira multicolorata TaxID=2654512 RepID=A0A833JEC9_9BACT|nr:chemotaxis-specific protein-glutamate methyltransferase CheB [Fluviispira multicolorata]KAB8029779.1 chemotaxis-specific protein-glutamate methyltransferase CheB [Fluviispira multicolorata]
MRVLIVDDSVVFRSQIKSALEGINDIVVVTSAANGKIALERLEQNTIDVIILDLEMPVMDGITMLEEMKKKSFLQKVIVFATPTGEGIDLALAALRAGASDFISKPISSGSLDEAFEGIQKELIPKILQFKSKIDRNLIYINKKDKEITIEPTQNIPQENIYEKKFSYQNLTNTKPKVIGFGSSTGGPTALEKIFEKIKNVPLNIPIFLTQHMPPKFTEALANRIAVISGHPTHEAKHGETALAGHIYVAPGDFHMSIDKAKDGQNIVICLDQGPKRNSVRPAVDTLFESLAKIYGNNCVAFVLTGMGEDGMIGAKAIKEAAGKIIIQDAESSTVWGMPGSVHATGAYDGMGNLDECAQYLIKMIS